MLGTHQVLLAPTLTTDPDLTLAQALTPTRTLAPTRTLTLTLTRPLQGTAFVRVCEADLARGGGDGGRAELLRLLLSCTSLLACDVRTACPYPYYHPNLAACPYPYYHPNLAACHPLLLATKGSPYLATLHSPCDLTPLRSARHCQLTSSS